MFNGKFKKVLFVVAIVAIAGLSFMAGPAQVVLAEEPEETSEITLTFYEDTSFKIKVVEGDSEEFIRSLEDVLERLNCPEDLLKIEEDVPANPSTTTITVKVVNMASRFFDFEIEGQWPDGLDLHMALVPKDKLPTVEVREGNAEAWFSKAGPGRLEIPTQSGQYAVWGRLEKNNEHTRADWPLNNDVGQVTNNWLNGGLDGLHPGVLELQVPTE